MVPRFGVAYDVNGNGDRVVHVNYGQYSGRYDEAQIGATARWATLPTSSRSIRARPDRGYGFAPGFNLANYPITSANASVTDPTQNVKMDPNLKSPLVHEFTVSYGTKLSSRGYGEVSYIARNHARPHRGLPDPADRHDQRHRQRDQRRHLYQQALHERAERSGEPQIPGTGLPVAVPDQQQLERERVRTPFSSRTPATTKEKRRTSPGTPRPIGNFPEAFNAARTFPFGDLQNFERNRLRLWSIYNWQMGSKGALSLSGLWRLDSGLAYSLAAKSVALTSTQIGILSAAGYPDQPGPQTVFFTGARGDQNFAGYGVFDMSVNYDVPVLRNLRPWVKFDVYNLLNNDKLIAWSTTVTPNKATPLDSLGLPTGYTPSATFGTATGNTVTNLNNANIQAYPLSFAGGQAGGPHDPSLGGFPLLTSIRSARRNQGRPRGVALFRRWEDIANKPGVIVSAGMSILEKSSSSLPVIWISPTRSA